MTVDNSQFRKLLRANQEEIIGLSHIHGVKKTESLINDENSSQTSQVGYNEDLSKKNRIEEIRNNVIKNVNNFYMLNYYKISLSVFFILSIIFIALYQLIFISVCDEVNEITDINSILFLTSNWLTYLISSLMSFKTLYVINAKEKEEKYNSYIGERDEYIKTLRADAVNWINLIDDHFALVEKNIGKYLNESGDFLWKKNEFMITFNVQNESFPLYLSKILSNANTLLHDEAFINFTIEKKELSQMEIIKIDYNSYIAINNLLHPDKQKELLQPSMSTNYLPKNDFITKTTHKRNRTLQEDKIEQSNTITTHCLSYNQLSIAEQIELDNENKETLEQISKLLNLLNQVEPIKPTVKRSNVNLQGKFNLFLKSPIRNLKTNKLYTPRNAFLNSNINNDKKSRPPSNISVMSCKRNTSRRTSLSKKGKRGSLPNIKLPKISVELEAKIKFGKFKNEKDFLEFAYHKLINNEYQLVYEMLKLFLKNYRHYDDKSIETTLECKNVLCPTTLYNDIKGLSSQLKTTKMEDKIKRLYLNSEYYYSILPKLKKLEGSDKQLSDMDKYLVQTITNKE